MKNIIIAALTLSLYGCIAAEVIVFGFKPAALMFIALVIMGVLEGIV